MRILRTIVCYLGLLSFGYKVKAQSLPVGSVGVEDYYRRAQLLGVLDSNISFTVRPLFKAGLKVKDIQYPDLKEVRYNLLNTESAFRSNDGKINGLILPLSMQTQFNSHHPYGWNDGAMIPAKGFQTVISGGLFAEYGPLSIQFKPELAIAGNSAFDTFDKDHYDIIVARYYDFYNNIDLPARFGNQEYSHAYWGQSSIRLNYSSLSVGLSTENLWWGPGMRNSLLMSNTAPGFKHLTLNTVKPIKTPIGSFEGQLIAGRLEGSGFGPLEPNRQYFYSDLYLPKPDDWRYLSGIVFTYQPKWVSGLFLGFTQTRQMYSKDLNGFSDYLPFFLPVKAVNADQPINKPDERNSIFMRWLWPAEHAEVYFEFGRNNFSGDFRNNLLEPNTSRAYIFGLRKMLPFNRRTDENILIGVEVTQLAETLVDKVLSASGWYTSPGVRHGYTNRGEVLGAGIGPGGNLQSLDVSWVRGIKRLGLQIERYVHNDDFYYYAYQDTKDFRRHWTDLSIGASGEWNYKNLIFNAKLQYIKSLNYQWYLLQQPGEPYMVNGKDANNLQIQAGATYRF
ncbi:capsule assembly Wzi family protein [Pedobacter duraquae]|uniref:Capsule assembly protein Wzi n=1 Tax=Pedobacter duraquae TaxID=425511 RepID=A0A4R6IEN8_9SPHI|nr:capsule assembly Wzi family protein [Pedobacter duraquae]TDO20161.1 capsule assembly protein Wzi [Pedobacter duraquae]